MPWCPTCGSPDTALCPVVGAHVIRQPGPGDRAEWQCQDCGAVFSAYAPEPMDGLPAEAWAGGWAANQ